VAPLFYDRDADGVPLGWLERIRHTLRSLGPKVQAERMVREYVSELYVPAALASRTLDAGEFGPAKELAAWKKRVVQAWPQLRIEHVESESDASGQRLGSALVVRASVALGELTPDDVTVEVVYGHPDDDDEIAIPAYATLAPGGGGGGPAPPPPPPPTPLIQASFPTKARSNSATLASEQHRSGPALHSSTGGVGTVITRRLSP
jgi:starch phosphorylase